jgi:hypothetical protein
MRERLTQFRAFYPAAGKVPRRGYAASSTLYTSRLTIPRKKSNPNVSVNPVIKAVELNAGSLLIF